MVCFELEMGSRGKMILFGFVEFCCRWLGFSNVVHEIVVTFWIYVIA